MDEKERERKEREAFIEEMARVEAEVDSEPGEELTEEKLEEYRKYVRKRMEWFR